MPEVLKQISGGAYKLKKLLRSAIQAGSLEIVEQSLDSGADINWSNEFNTSTLSLAAKHGRDDVVQLLLQRGADINAQDKFFGNAVHAAACSGQLSTVRLLIEREPPANIHVLGPMGIGQSQRGTILQGAAASGNPKVVDYLLQCGVDVTESSDEIGNALGVASYCGDVEAVRVLLSYGADISSNTGKFGTALHRGAKSGNILVVQELLTCGADPNILGGDLVTALEVAAKIGHAGIINILVGHGARTEVHEDDNSTFGKESKGALGAAASQGWVSIFNQLLDAGADPHHVHPYSSTAALQEAAKAGQFKIISTAVDRNISVDPSDLLFHALDLRWISSNFTGSNPTLSFADYLDQLTYFLELGADPNYLDPITSDFPLLVAVRQEHQNKVINLVSRGADVNRQNHDGWTALLEAVKTRQQGLIKQLVEEHHADISKTLINGSTAFHVAAQTGFVSTIELLLDNGQDIDQVNKNGNSALHVAIEYLSLDPVAFLLRRNANSSLQNAQGMTAIDLAEFNNSPDSVKYKWDTEMIVKMLQEHCNVIKQ